jgi:hypothetical protein
MFSGHIKDQAALLWGGMKHADRKLTPGGVLRLFQEHSEKGQQYDPVVKKAIRVCFESGVLGQYNDVELNRLLSDEELGKAEAQ